MPEGGFVEPTDLLLYDRAGKRGNLGHNICFVTSGSKFEEGPQQSVMKKNYSLIYITINVQK